MRITQTEMTFHSQFLSNYIQKQNKKEVFMLIEARKKELLVLQMVIQKIIVLYKNYPMTYIFQNGQSKN
ncbi:hypothetical protein EB50_02214 [Enterococcus faecium]|nr:hypothetical protein EB50_02214 [Enterococcus faecium]